MPSRGRGRPLSRSSGAHAVYRRVRLGLGRISRGLPAVRLVASRCLDIFHPSQRVACGVLSGVGFPPSSPRLCGVSFHGQYHSAFIPPQGRGYSIFDPQLRGPGYPSALRGQRSVSAPLVCAWPPQRPCGHPQPRLSIAGVRMDSFHGGLSGAIPSLAGHSGSRRHISQPSAPGLLLPNGGSPGCGHRCDAPVLGSSPGLLLPAVWVHPALPHQGSPLPQPGGNSGGSVLAASSVVPGPLGALGRGTSPFTSAQGPSVPATLPPLPSEPPSARSDWVSHCQQAARHFGFSSQVACQLTFCRRPSTRLNYQSKWNAYRAWCRSQGHSVLRPSIPKVADFLLYLRRSLHLSYSSIASFCSMLISAFRFVLLELSSHPVLHDLLRSFRI